MACIIDTAAWPALPYDHLKALASTRCLFRTTRRNSADRLSFTPEIFILPTFPFSPFTPLFSLFTYHLSLPLPPVSFSIGRLSFWIGPARAAGHELARDHSRACSYRIEAMDDFARSRPSTLLRHRCCHRQLHRAAGDHLNRSRSSGVTHSGMRSVRRSRTDVKQRRLE